MSGYGFTSAGTTYDDEDRLTGFSRTSGTFNQTWNLSSVGEWTSVTTNGTPQARTHGPTHELLTAGGQSVTTDVKGNITLLPAVLSGLSSPASSLSYDFDNKLKTADVDNNATVDVNFHYDALGRRVARQGSSGSFVYIQHDQQTIADYIYGNAPASPLYRYVYASYIDEPVVRKAATTGGTIHYYHRNQQFSVTAVTNSAGAVAERYAYTAYGQPTFLDSSGSPLTPQVSSLYNRYTYTGREWDATLGLYHYRARWMSPVTGRFMGRDPIRYEGSEWDLYEYCESKPLTNLDPHGMCSMIGSISDLWNLLWRQRNSAIQPPPQKISVPLLTSSNCLKWCNDANPSPSGGAFCKLFCDKMVTGKSFACREIGRLCYRFRDQNNLKMCLSMCHANCPPGDCAG